MRLEPLAQRRTRIKLLLNTYLDAIDNTSQGEQDGRPSSRPLTFNDQLWPYGSYHLIQVLLDELRSNYRHGVYNCVWSVHVIGSKRHMRRRAPKAELGLDWLVLKTASKAIYVPAEVSQNAGYDRHDALLWATTRERHHDKAAA